MTLHGLREVERGEYVTVGYRIMAVKERAEWADELSERFDCGVTWDTERQVWETGRRALVDASLDDDEADWVVVIQDDSLIGPEFSRSVVAEALRWVDEPRPVAFYTGDAGRFRRPEIIAGHDLAEQRGAGWVEAVGPVWGPVVAIPTDHIEALVSYADRNTAKGYDTKIMNYWRSQRTDCWYTSPSLVDHRPVSENPSAISASNRTANRQAYKVGVHRDWGLVQRCDAASLRPWVWMTDGF